MLRFVLPKYSLLALLLCLGAASVPAQESETSPPLLPDFAMPPPDPETLAPPPEVEWEPLTEQASREDTDVVAADVSVPAAEPEEPIAPPPPPLVETFPPGEPDAAEIDLVKPEVEIWRVESESPQVRRGASIGWSRPMSPGRTRSCCGCSLIRWLPAKRFT